MKVKTTTLAMPVDLWQRLKIACATRDMLVRELVQKFLVDGLDRLDHEDGGN